MKRSRHLFYCKGCGTSFYTTDPQQRHCQPSCQGKKWCRACERSLPVVCFKDKRGTEHPTCRDCFYNTQPIDTKPRLCPDCGEDAGTGYRCADCSRKRLKKYVSRGSDLVVTALVEDCSDPVCV